MIVRFLKNYGVALIPLAIILPITLYGFYVLAHGDPPLRYSETVYLPERDGLCPGETLVYTNTLTVDIPGAIYSGATWYSGRGKLARPIVPLKVSDMEMRAFVDVPFTFANRRRTNLVPPGLPVGPAEMRWVATNFRGRDAVHAVPFTIRADCG